MRRRNCEIIEEVGKENVFDIHVLVRSLGERVCDFLHVWEGFNEKCSV